MRKKSEKNQNYCGLEVGSQKLKFIQLKRHRGKLFLAHWGEETLLEGTVEQGRIRDPEQLGAALKHLLSKTGLHNPQVVLALSPQQAIIRHLTLPRMPTQEIMPTLQNQMQTMLPISLSEVALAFAVNPEIVFWKKFLPQSLHQEKTQRVLVAAAKRNVLDPLLSGVIQGGAQPLAIELEPMALWRILDLSTKNSGSRHEPGLHKRVLTVHFNPPGIQISLFQQDMLQFSRSIAEFFSSAEDLNQEFLRQYVLPEIWRTLDLQQHTMPGQSVDQIILTGVNGVNNEGRLRHFFQQETGIPVAFGMDHAKGPLDADLSPEELAQFRAAYAISLGLALRAAQKPQKFTFNFYSQPLPELGQGKTFIREGAVVAGTLLTLAGLWSGWQVHEIRQKEQVLADLQLNQSEQNPRRSAAQVAGQPENIAQHREILETIRSSRSKPDQGADILAQIHGLVPSGCRVEELKYQAAGVEIKGTADSYVDLAHFLHLLETNLLFGQIDLQSSHVDEVSSKIQFHLSGVKEK